MNGLDHSPLEALAFDYLSYGLLTVVNNIWTWVALITAAISFLTIKASSPVRLFISSPFERIASEPASTSGEPVETTASTSSSSSSKTASFRALERQGSTKEKFISYYYDNNDGEDSETWKGDDDREVNGGDGGEVVEEGWWDMWEKVIKTKMGDEDCYRYQDLTVINGNVVRLWDGR